MYNNNKYLISIITKLIKDPINKISLCIKWTHPK